ncbi:MAG: hypothetical protein HY241_16780 [Actinobacteria bacterium]|nr:hypothetical protein [Actinomycetota bacterium]
MFLGPRWLAVHALVVTLVAGFLALAWWQLRRATEGNILSFGYALEWPLFAVFTVVVWIRAMRDRVRPPDPVLRYPAARPAAEQPASRPVLPRRPGPDRAPEDDETLSEYNRYLAFLDAHEPTR